MGSEEYIDFRFEQNSRVCVSLIEAWYGERS